MAKLEDKAYTPNKPTILPAYSSNASQKKSYGWDNRSISNWGRGSYSNEQGKSTETCLHYHTSGYSESIYWKKYSESLLNTQKKI